MTRDDIATGLAALKWPCRFSGDADALFDALPVADPAASAEADGQAVHAAWRDGMLAQGRAVAPERMSWDTLSEQDKALDARIEAAIRSAGTPPASRDDEPDFLDGARLEYRECMEVRRLLGYLWTATGNNHLRPVHTLFDADDPIVADVERLAIMPDAETDR